MSKRFGRNQRRKAREQIASLHESNTRYARQYDAAVQRKAALEDSVRATAEILGSNFVGLPPEMISVLYPTNSVRVPSYTGIPQLGPAEDLLQAVAYVVHELRAYEMRAQLDKLRGLMHVNIVTPTGKRYAMTQDCFCLPRQAVAHYLADNVGRRIVDELMQEFKNA